MNKITNIIVICLLSISLLHSETIWYEKELSIGNGKTIHVSLDRNGGGEYYRYNLKVRSGYKTDGLYGNASGYSTPLTGEIRMNWAVFSNEQYFSMTSATIEEVINEILRRSPVIEK